MTVIHDRRQEPPDDKYVQDKIRYRDLYMDRIRKALHEKIANDSLDNLGKGGLNVPIPKETTHQPVFHHAEDGGFHKVFPGNIKFDVGDRFRKSGGGKGKVEDDFIWLNEEEVLDILFEGRSLPDMTKRKAAHVKLMERERSGYTNKGSSHRMDMVRTDKKRRDDKMVLTKTSERRIIANLTEQFNILSRPVAGAEHLDLSEKTKEEKDDIAQRVLNFVLKGNPQGHALPEGAIMALDMAVATLKRDMISLAPPEDRERIETLESHLREQFKIRERAGNFHERHMTYEYDDDVPKPSAKAVMFWEMDVSGSMDQETKNTAKVFFWLLRKFMEESYAQVEIVRISHTTEAKEVDEKTFFYGQETGGTIVSSCLQKAKEIIAERYPPEEWNIYSAQASDGDNDSRDNEMVARLMEELLPSLQAHYYVEVPNEWSRVQGKISPLSKLGRVFEKLIGKYPGKVYVASNIRAPKDSLEAFKHFFPVGATAPAGVMTPGGP